MRRAAPLSSRRVAPAHARAAPSADADNHYVRYFNGRAGAALALGAVGAAHATRARALLAAVDVVLVTERLDDASAVLAHAFGWHLGPGGMRAHRAGTRHSEDRTERNEKHNLAAGTDNGSTDALHGGARVRSLELGEDEVRTLRDANAHDAAMYELACARFDAALAAARAENKRKTDFVWQVHAAREEEERARFDAASVAAASRLARERAADAAGVAARARELDELSRVVRTINLQTCYADHKCKVRHAEIPASLDVADARAWADTVCQESIDNDPHLMITFEDCGEQLAPDVSRRLERAAAIRAAATGGSSEVLEVAVGVGGVT